MLESTGGWGTSGNAEICHRARYSGRGKFAAARVASHLTKSCGVLQKLGPQIPWLHSYVTQDKTYCVYIAPDEKTVREHANQGGFPANRFSEIKTMIDPTTAE